LNNFIIIIVSVVFISTLVRIFDNENRTYPITQDYNIHHDYFSQFIPDSIGDRMENLPDIYFIILDAYTSSRVLNELYNYDNSVFENFLKDRGFIIFDSSYSNYPNTSNSITSTMNLDYISNFQEYLKPNQKNYYDRITHLFQNNKVNQIFQSMGYKTVNIGGDYQSFNNKYFDLNIDMNTSEELFNQLVRTSMLLHVDDVFGFLKRERILKTFEAVSNVAYDKELTFTFAHILIPHGPHVFNRVGETVLFSKMSYENKTHHSGGVAAMRYLDQLIFTNTLAIELIDQLITNSSKPPIIIIQGDHGNTSLMPKGGWPDTPSLEILFELMSNMNAMYLPECDNIKLNRTITPVNTFRFLLNSCFGTDLQLLDDKYFYTNKLTEYQFYDITEKIKSFP